jgi:hypothetical protein
VSYREAPETKKGLEENYKKQEDWVEKGKRVS